MKTKAQTSSDLLPAADHDAIYRQHIADVILAYVTQQGRVDSNEAYRQVMTVTKRTLGTVRNWLAYRVNFPDVPSLARIVEHWNIPPEVIFPAQLDSLLAGQPHEPLADDGVRTSADQLILSLYGPNDTTNLDRALLKYTDHPKAAVLVRQDGSEMLDQIRPGELLLVDPTWEQIRGSGLYLLKFSVPGQADKTCVRIIDLLMSEPAVRVSCGNAMPASNVETLPLRDGHLPSHITVLGRVVAVLRQT